MFKSKAGVCGSPLPEAGGIDLRTANQSWCRASPTNTVLDTFGGSCWPVAVAVPSARKERQRMDAHDTEAVSLAYIIRAPFVLGRWCNTSGLQLSTSCRGLLYFDGVVNVSGVPRSLPSMHAHRAPRTARQEAREPVLLWWVRAGGYRKRK